jgi:uncharacterized membrane protein YkoI
MVMNYKTLTTTTKIVSGVVILSAIITITGASISTTIQQNASAQTTTNSNATNMMTDTMIGPRGVMVIKTNDENVTSSINSMNILSNAIESQVKVSLNNATTTAENSVGNNSHAVAARIGDENGYLVYTIWVLDPNMKFNKVIVDPGNGQVLLSKQMSIEEHKGIMMMMGPAMSGPIIPPDPMIALGPIIQPGWPIILFAANDTAVIVPTE